MLKHFKCNKNKNKSNINKVPKNNIKIKGEANG